MGEDPEISPEAADDPEGNGHDNLQLTAASLDRDEILISYLARGATRDQAAKASGYSQRTVYVRVADPAFRLRVSEHRRGLIDAATGRLAAVSSRAVDVLAAALDDDSASIRIRAASVLLDALLRVQTHVEFEERLAAIEERAVRAGGRRA